MPHSHAPVLLQVATEAAKAQAGVQHLGACIVLDHIFETAGVEPLQVGACARGC